MSTFLAFPHTPAPSIHSSIETSEPETPPIMSSYASHIDEPKPGYQDPYFPPSPPSLDDSPRSQSPYSGIVPNLPSELHFTEQLRNRRARRPVSVIAAKAKAPFLPPRKYTDPTPRSRSFLEDTEELSPGPQQLDVDLDAYSTTDYDGDEVDSRAPTLSFVTTSTDSTTGTPPSGAYGSFRPDVDVKPEHEPRIRVRTTTGRANAYSSAESSMGSGAYSYHSYSDNHIYHPHPPPMPAIPLAYAPAGPRVTSPTGTSSSGLPPSPTSYQHRPWHRDVSKHIRNESASTTSTESDEPSPDGYEYNEYNLEEHVPWGEVTEARALLSVEEGRESIFDAARLRAMGGVDMTDEAMRSLAGVTHLLLPDIGSSILHILPSLIAVLAPSLLVADLSDNDLTFLPESLRLSSNLEELNVSNNPLRQLPSWLADLSSMRVLVVDGCSLAGMPGEMSRLGQLHSVCARRNKLVSLPAWLCLLTQLETLRVDDNPFAPEWVPIVSPILAAASRSVLPDPIQSTPSSSSIHSSAAESTHMSSIVEDDSRSQQPSPVEFTTPFNRLRKMRSAGNILNIRSTNICSDEQLLSPTSAGPSPLSAGMTPSPSSSLASSSSRFGNLDSARGRRSSTAEDAGMTSSKSGKWSSLLRKMSRQHLKPSLTASASSNVKLMPPPLKHNDSEPGPSRPIRPQLAAAHSATVPSRSMGIEEEISEFGVGRAMAETLPGLPIPSQPRKGKRRSFLPIDPTPPSINITIPSASPFNPTPDFDDKLEILPTLQSDATIADDTLTASSSLADALDAISDETESRYSAGLESIKSYLRDLYDLSRPPLELYGDALLSTPGSPVGFSASDRRRDAEVEAPKEGKRFKDDKTKRVRILKEIYETERTYVRGLGELVRIYLGPAAQPIKPGQTETVIPAQERKVVFSGIEAILSIHRDSLLPAIEKAIAPLLEGADDEAGILSAETAHQIGSVYRTHIPYLRQYTSYTNAFDNALTRLSSWVLTTNSTVASMASLAATGAAGSVGMSPTPSIDNSRHMTAAQRKRVNKFMDRARQHPMHSQISLESYLLLPIQRIPRYRLLLDDLAMCTPPTTESRDALDDALNEVSALAVTMNEEKRMAESRLKLYHYQRRISTSGASPLVQPHRRLIFDGSLVLSTLVTKRSSYQEVDRTVVDGDTIVPSKAVVPVDHLLPQLMSRKLTLILCSDLLVLVEEGRDGKLDLFNVMRMGTVQEPAGVVQGRLRVVDNKSIYYFCGDSPDNVLEWCRAINTARRR